MKVGGQLHDLIDLPLEIQTPVLTEQESGWGPEPVWIFRRRDKYSPLPEIEPQTSYCTTLTWLLVRNRVFPRSYVVGGSETGDVCQNGVIRDSSKVFPLQA